MDKPIRLIMLIMLFFSPAITAHGIAEETVPDEPTESFDRLQVSFIANKGQIENKEAAYFVQLDPGYIYVDKNGMITHTFSSPSKHGIVIHEIVAGENILVTPLEPLPIQAIAAIRLKDQSIGENLHYYRLSYGKILEGIELQLLAFTDNLAKIFTIAPGSDPGAIMIKLKGVEGVKVGDAGALEIRTRQGSADFSPPQAYQFFGKTRKPVDVAYVIRKNTTYGFKLGSYDKARPLFIAPIVPAFLLSAP